MFCVQNKKNVQQNGSFSMQELKETVLNSSGVSLLREWFERDDYRLNVSSLLVLHQVVYIFKKKKTKILSFISDRIML